MIVKSNRPGECSNEKECCRWWWLTFRQPERHYRSHSTITKSFDSDDDLHSGFRNISHRQQSFSGPHSPERSDNTITWPPGSNHLPHKELKCTGSLHYKHPFVFYIINTKQVYDLLRCKSFALHTTIKDIL